MFDCERVKKLLREKKKTQSELAAYTDLSKSTLSDKLNNKTKFTVEEAFKVAKFFNTDINVFYKCI